jgi:bifunctional N-acetylglucosamine-1-phosphate-uridyltransferase/glucosamine-1-phosphate-acetyltransferase GlmU-like protein
MIHKLGGQVMIQKVILVHRPVKSSERVVVIGVLHL